MCEVQDTSGSFLIRILSTYGSAMDTARSASLGSGRLILPAIEARTCWFGGFATQLDSPASSPGNALRANARECWRYRGTRLEPGLTRAGIRQQDTNA